MESMQKLWPPFPHCYSPHKEIPDPNSDHKLDHEPGRKPEP